jgi:hypothetical protein
VLAKVRSVLPSTQLGEGGVVQLTPEQGSPLHCPLAQPKGQVFSVGE